MLWIILGLMLGMIIIYTEILKLKDLSRCATKVQAQYVDKEDVTNFGSGRDREYCCIMKYTYKNVDYCEVSTQVFPSRNFIERDFNKGQIYDIYLDENDPKKYRLNDEYKENIKVKIVVVLCLGCMFLMPFVILGLFM